MIVVIGGSGTIGTHIVNKLIKHEIHFRVGSHKRKKYKSEFVRSVHFDFYDESTYDNVLGDASVLFFLRPPQMGDAKEFKPFIHAASKSGVQHIVFLSLMGVSKNPFPPHHTIEKMIKKSSMAYTFIRPSFFMENLIYPHGEDIKNLDKIIIPAGRAKTSFIAGRDIGEVIGTILIKPKPHQYKAYTLTGPTALTYYEVADTLTEILNREIIYTKPSLLRYRKHMLQRGFDKGYVFVTMMLYIMTRLNTAKKTTETVKKLLQRNPITLHEFVVENKDYFVR